MENDASKFHIREKDVGAAFSGDLTRTASVPEGFLTRHDFRGVEEIAIEEKERELHVRQSWYVRMRRVLREPLSEGLGSALLIIYGDGAVAQAVLSANTAGSTFSINLGFGIGLFVGYLAAIAGGAQGHLNPVVTLTMMIFRKFPWKKGIIYMFAQFLGCGFGAAVIWGVYRTSINEFDGGHRALSGDFKTGNIFCTYPQSYLDFPAKFMSEVSATAVLLISVNAISCQTSSHLNYKLPVEWQLVRAMSLALMLWSIGCSLGWQTGYAINPARDFAPRMVSYMAGYGRGVFTDYGNYAWIPIVAPVVGGIIGQIIFDFMIYEGPVQSFVTRPSIAREAFSDIIGNRKHQVLDSEATTA
ncbi:aquaporin-like protein [Dipodascopsis uninucleata]